MNKLLSGGLVSMLLLSLTACSPNDPALIPPASTTAPGSLSFNDASEEETNSLRLSDSLMENTAHLSGENVFLVLYGSSSCPVVPETVTLDEAVLSVVVAPITAEACTADFGPHVTKVETSGTDVDKVEIMYEDGRKSDLPLVDYNE